MSQSDFALPPSLPRKPAVISACLRAVSRPRRMLGLLPLVLKTISISPALPSASICGEILELWSERGDLGKKVAQVADRAIKKGLDHLMNLYRERASCDKSDGSAALRRGVAQRSRRILHQFGWLVGSPE